VPTLSDTSRGILAALQGLLQVALDATTDVIHDDRRGGLGLALLAVDVEDDAEEDDDERDAHFS